MADLHNIEPLKHGVAVLEKSYGNPVVPFEGNVVDGVFEKEEGEWKTMIKILNILK